MKNSNKFIVSNVLNRIQWYIIFGTVTAFIIFSYFSLVRYLIYLLCIFSVLMIVLQWQKRRVERYENGWSEVKEFLVRIEGIYSSEVFINKDRLIINGAIYPFRMISINHEDYECRREIKEFFRGGSREASYKKTYLFWEKVVNFSFEKQKEEDRKEILKIKNGVLRKRRYIL